MEKNSICTEHGILISFNKLGGGEVLHASRQNYVGQQKLFSSMCNML